MRKHVLVFFIFLGLFFTFFWRLIFLGHVFYCCDNLLINYPAKTFFVNWIYKGIFPLWYPNIFSGIPYLADINLSPLYPGQFLYVIFGKIVSIYRLGTIDILFHLIIAFVGIYVCAISLGLRKSISLFSGLIYIFSGSVVTYINNLPMLQVAAIFPWMFFGVLMIINRKTNIRIVVSAVLYALLIISGHPQLTFYTTIFLATYLYYFSSGRFINKIKLLIYTFGLGLLLASLQLIPFLELAFLSTREFFANNYSGFGSISTLQLVRFILPTITGSPAIGTVLWQGGSVTGYVGILPITLLLNSFTKNKRNLFFIFAIIISLVLALGDNTIFFRIFKLIPFFSLFRVPTNALLVYTFCISILSGLVLSDLCKEKKQITKYLNLGWLLGTFGIICYICSTNILEILQAYLYLLPNKIQIKLININLIDLSLYSKHIAFNLILIGFSLALFYVFHKNIKNKYIPLLFSILFFIDIYFVCQGNILTIPEKELNSYKKNELWQDNDLRDPTYRVYIHPSSYQSNNRVKFGENRIPAEIAWQFKIIRPNVGIENNIHYVNGYGSMIFKKYQEYFGLIPLDPTGVNIGEQNSKELNDLAVKYVILRENSTDNEIKLISRETAKPKVRLELQNGGIEDVKILKYNPNYLLTEIQSSVSGTLVFADSNYPGWVIHIDKSTGIIPEKDSLLKKINLTAGIHEVAFSFQPKSVILGFIGSSLGIFICFYAALKSVIKALIMQKKK